MTLLKLVDSGRLLQTLMTCKKTTSTRIGCTGFIQFVSTASSTDEVHSVK